MPKRISSTHSISGVSLSIIVYLEGFTPKFIGPLYQSEGKLLGALNSMDLLVARLSFGLGQTRGLVVVLSRNTTNKGVPVKKKKHTPHICFEGSKNMTESEYIIVWCPHGAKYHSLLLA